MDVNELVVTCPHCNIPILIEKLNCRIFRHGVFKTTGKQIHPHAPKELCDLYIRNDMIYGCSKPFQVIGDNAVACDYI